MQALTEPKTPHFSQMWKNSNLMARWRARGPKLFIRSAETWSFLLVGLFFSTLISTFSWLHVVITKMGGRWQGSHGRYGLRSRQKSCELKRCFSFCLRSIFAFFGCLYMKLLQLIITWLFQLRDDCSVEAFYSFCSLLPSLPTDII